MLAACPFCELRLGGRALAFESRHYLAVESKRKIARTHLVLLPKRHVPQREGMRDARLVRDLVCLAKHVVPDDSSLRVFIHPPPFYSVDHFHVHCLAGEYKNPYQQLAHEWFAIRV